MGRQRFMKRGSISPRCATLLAILALGCGTEEAETAVQAGHGSTPRAFLVESLEVEIHAKAVVPDLSSARLIARFPDGDLLFVMPPSERVHRLIKVGIGSGQLIGLAGTGDGPGELRLPTWVSVEPATGDVFAFDAATMHVLKIHPGSRGGSESCRCPITPRARPIGVVQRGVVLRAPGSSGKESISLLSHCSCALTKLEDAVPPSTEELLVPCDEFGARCLTVAPRTGLLHFPKHLEGRSIPRFGSWGSTGQRAVAEQLYKDAMRKRRIATSGQDAARYAARIPDTASFVAEEGIAFLSGLAWIVRGDGDSLVEVRVVHPTQPDRAFQVRCPGFRGGIAWSAPSSVVLHCPGSGDDGGPGWLLLVSNAPDQR